MSDLRRLKLMSVEIDGKRYWSTQDVVAAVNELLIVARTDDERQLVSWFLRALQESARKPL